jgi:hypothetical protein
MVYVACEPYNVYANGSEVELMNLSTFRTDFKRIHRAVHAIQQKRASKHAST